MPNFAPIFSTPANSNADCDLPPFFTHEVTYFVLHFIFFHLTYHRSLHISTWRCRIEQQKSIYMLEPLHTHQKWNRVSSYAVVQLQNRVWRFATPWTAACQAPLSSTVPWSLLRFMSVESVMLSNHFILCCSVFLLPSIVSSIKVFSYESESGGQSIGASASVLPTNIQDWFPLGLTSLILLAVRETLKSLLQHHSSKASILWRSAFFIVQLSHPYMTTGKTIAFTGWTFVSKVMSLLFNMLSRFVRTFLPRSKHL